MLRGSEAYDTGSTDLIVAEYFERFARYHRVDPDVGRWRLMTAVDAFTGYY